MELSGIIFTNKTYVESKTMKLYSRIITSKEDYRKGSWTCDAYSVGIDTSDSNNQCLLNIKYTEILSERMNFIPFVILYKVAPHGFNRIEKYKGLEFQKRELLLDHCEDFLVSDSGCEYMYSFAEIASKKISSNIFNLNHAVIGMGTEISYRHLITSISEFKSVKNIENYMIESGMIIVESFDTIDIGSSLWFVSNKETIDWVANELGATQKL